MKKSKLMEKSELMEKSALMEENHSSAFYQSIEAIFGKVTDRRNGTRQYYNLLDIIGLTIVGVLAGANTWTEIELYGKSNEEWLKELLPLENGIPSHDTLGRVFSMLDPDELEICFREWTVSLGLLCEGLQVSIDGKAIRGSHDKGKGKKPIHMVSAWVNDLKLSMAQVKVADKSNEISAIEQLLDLLELKNQVVTIDAMGAQKSIAEKIEQKGGHYILALKENHSTLYEEVRSTFAHLQHSDAPYVDRHEQWDKGHGRIEQRVCYVLDVTHENFDWIEPQDLQSWAALRSVIMIQATREVDGQKQTSCRYYLSSLPASTGAEQFNKYIRSHWGIENSLHWVLDVHFREDDSRVRKERADQNLAMIRRLVINVLRLDKDSKASLRGRRKKAGWDPNYLIYLLNLFAVQHAPSN